MPNATIPVMSREGIERLAADTGGWEELPTMFEVFLTDLRERLRMLAEILESGDCSGVGDIAHVLKSTAATFGAAEVTDVAKRALAAARSGARAELEPLARELLAAMERALDAYENFDFSQQG